MARFGVILVTLLTLLAGCKSVEYIPQESVRTDSLYISQWKHDSIYVQDSVLVREKGDTIFISKTQYKYIERCLHDTLWQTHTDSIAVPYPVEKQLSRTDRLKIQVGGFVLSAVWLMVIVGLFILLLKRLKMW